MLNQQTLIIFFFGYYIFNGMSWGQIFGTSILLLGTFLYLIYQNQEKLLYLNEAIAPKRTSENPTPYQNPKQMSLDYINIHLTTLDKLQLHCWWIPQSSLSSSSSNSTTTTTTTTITTTTTTMTKTTNNLYPTILFFHENAGNMGFRLPNIHKMFHDLHVNVFILSYRGYGESEGVPNEEGIKIDAETAFEYIYENSEKLNVDREKIFVFGRSLGGAVAIYLASKHSDRLAGVILENTFTSISDMVKKVFRFLDFDVVKRYMLRLQWKSIDLIDQITCPLLFLSSGKDEVVPCEQMQELHKRAIKTQFKSWHSIPQAMHNDAWITGGDGYWKEIRTFLEDCMKKAQKQQEKKSE